MNTLRELFLSELADMYDAERRIVKALPKLAKAATCGDLKAAFLAHLKESEGHVKKVEQVFKSFDQKPKEKPVRQLLDFWKKATKSQPSSKGLRHLMRP